VDGPLDARHFDVIADAIAVEIGFNLVQGALFAKPMPAKKFARSVLGRGAPWPLA
jgi:hypothetical protein